MINNIKIQNYKSLKDIDLSLSNLNILTGLNGMGKSSLIQSLLLLKYSYINKSYFRVLYLKTPDLSLGMSKDVLYQYAKEDMISFELSFDKDEIENISLSYDAIKSKDYLERIESEETSLYMNNNIEKLANEAIFNEKNFQYLNSNLISPRTMHDTNDYLVSQCENIGIHGEFTIQYLNEYGRKFKVQSVLKHPKSKSDSLNQNLEAWLSEISPGIRLNITSIPGDTKIILNYQFETNSDTTDQFAPINVGYGINYVIPIITALLKADKDKMIIIESPEAYLHPKGQSKIGELAALAASTGAQIIIETHSDHVINGIRVATKHKRIEPDNIRLYFFDRDYDSNEHFSYVHEMKIDTDGRLDYWPHGFMDEWENNLLELV